MLESFVLDGSPASGASVDSRVVVTSTADASAERVVTWVVRDRAVGSVRLVRVVTEPVDGSTARARVVTTPVDGSVSVEELPSGDVVTRGADDRAGAAPVVVVIPSDEPGGASVDAGPSVGIGQPSGCAPDPVDAVPDPVVGASGESLPPVPGARVDPVPVAVASPGRSAVAGAADVDGGSELLGPSIGIGQPSGATAGTATAGVCAAPSCSFAAPPVSFCFGASGFVGASAFSPIFGSSIFGAAGASAFFGRVGLRRPIRLLRPLGGLGGVGLLRCLRSGALRFGGSRGRVVRVARTRQDAAEHPTRDVLHPGWSCDRRAAGARCRVRRAARRRHDRRQGCGGPRGRGRSPGHDRGEWWVPPRRRARRRGGCTPEGACSGQRDRGQRWGERVVESSGVRRRSTGGRAAGGRGGRGPQIGAGPARAGAGPGARQRPEP